MSCKALGAQGKALFGLSTETLLIRQTVPLVFSHSLIGSNAMQQQQSYAARFAAARRDFVTARKAAPYQLQADRADWRSACDLVTQCERKVARLAAYRNAQPGD